MRDTLRRAGILLAVSAALTLPAGTAVAAAPVHADGQCSAGSDWELDVNPNNGFLEITYDVDSDVEGQIWRYRVIANGTIRVQGLIETIGGGAFRVEALAPDQAGADRVIGQARNTQTGETCTGRVLVR